MSIMWPHCLNVFFTPRLVCIKIKKCFPLTFSVTFSFSFVLYHFLELFLGFPAPTTSEMLFRPTNFLEMSNIIISSEMSWERQENFENEAEAGIRSGRKKSGKSSWKRFYGRKRKGQEKVFPNLYVCRSKIWFNTSHTCVFSLFASAGNQAACSRNSATLPVHKHTDNVLHICWKVTDSRYFLIISNHYADTFKMNCWWFSIEYAIYFRYKNKYRIVA